MRKLLSSFLVFVLLVGISGCSFWAEKVTADTYDQAYITAHVAADSVDTIFLGGPLYTGAQTFSDSSLQDFQKQKQELIRFLDRKEGELWENMEALRKDLYELRSVYTELIAQVAEVEKSMGRQAKELAVAMLKEPVGFYGQKALYTALQSGSGALAVTSLSQYQALFVTVEASQTLTRDMATLVSGVTSLEVVLRTSTKDELKKLGADMELRVAPMVDHAGEKLYAVQTNVLQIQYLLRVLESADYYMGRESVTRMDEVLMQAQTQLATLAPKEGVTQEDIAFFKEMLVQYQDLSKGLGGVYDAQDSTRILPVEETAMGLLPQAHARGYGGKALTLLKSGLNGSYELGKSLGALTWNGAKSAFQGAKTVTGVSVDTLGAVTKSGFDVIFGAANGNSTQEIADEMKKNFTSVKDNFDKGTSGSSTMKTASGYFEGVEKGAGDLASGAVEKTLGKGWTSWAAGHVGQLSANMVVSFGKGITKIADTKATTGEIIEGGLDVGLSFIGGSKVLVSGSQILAGSKEALKTFGKKGVNFLGNILHSADLKKLKGISAEILEKTKLTPKDVETLISNSLSIEIKEGIKAEITQVSKNLNKEFMELLKKGAATVLDNSTTGAKKAYTEFVQDAFENSLKGYKDALLGVLGKDFTTFVDNLVATKADDMIKEIIKEYVDKGIIPGMPTYPELDAIKGTWPTGSMKVSDVLVSPEFRANAQKEGCNLEEIEAQKGKEQKLQMSVHPESAQGGYIMIAAPGEKAQKLPFTYEEGQMKVQGGESGEFAVEGTMEFEEVAGEYRMRGNLDINYQKGALVIKSDVSATYPK